MHVKGRLGVFFLHGLYTYIKGVLYLVPPIMAPPAVRTSPEMGPGATVGTSGLGYPLLLYQDSRSYP